jgi:hypothetical protein
MHMKLRLLEKPPPQNLETQVNPESQSQGQITQSRKHRNHRMVGMLSGKGGEFQETECGIA